MEDAPHQAESLPLRVLVASALGSIIEPALSARYSTVELVTSRAALSEKLPGSLVFDVAVVDLIWNQFETEWTFDGLDVLAALAATGRAASVLIAVHGYDAERDYLDEAFDHPLVHGIILKSDGYGVLIAAIETLSAGGEFHSEGLPGEIFQSDRSTIARWFDAVPMVAHVAGAIASKRASTWSQVASVTSFAESYVSAAPQKFGEGLYSLGEVVDPTEVNQATIFRWSGEHARFVLSWCRRHGLSDYSRPSRRTPGGR
ncbi:MAG: DNA-binding NarL/FixJ family response regulator [Candidatus Aldehydirespiratoraceae bacterium]|jgi:DNA-binding NarL/FixJ family response regulator